MAARTEAEGVKVMKKLSRKEQRAEELRKSDLTAQAVGRSDIEYGEDTELPKGQHVANIGVKPSEKKKGS